MPSYDGPTPTRPENERYTYEFIGWDKPIVPVTENTVYTARYRPVPKEVEIDEPEIPIGEYEPAAPDASAGDRDSGGSKDSGQPKTGDTQNLYFWLLVMAAAAGGSIFTMGRMRKK